MVHPRVPKPRNFESGLMITFLNLSVSGMLQYYGRNIWTQFRSPGVEIQLRLLKDNSDPATNRYRRRRKEKKFQVQPPSSMS